MKRPFVVASGVAALVVAAAIYWAFSRDDELGDVLTLHGNVDIRQLSLAFEGNGRIESLTVDEGDAVQAGQILGRLDTRTLAFQAAQAQARVEAQQQTLRQLRAGARPQELSQARARAAAADSDAARAQEDLARLEGIAAKTNARGVSVQELDRARSAARMTQSRALEQREGLKLLQAGAREEELSAAEAQLRAMQADLDLLRHQVSQGELKAPSDAVVRSRLMEPGELASAQRAVYSLALTQPKWIRVYVSELNLAAVQPGMAAQVLTDNNPGRAITGKVGYISSVAEFTPKSVQTEELRTTLVYEVRVLVQDPDNLLRMGQPATVRLTRRTDTAR